MRIGVVNGILVNFDAESHFWWHRKETGESQGIAVGIRRGRERNVFSRINARIYTREYINVEKRVENNTTNVPL